MSKFQKHDARKGLSSASGVRAFLAVLLAHAVCGVAANGRQVANCTISLTGTTARVDCQGPSTPLVAAVGHSGITLEPGTNVRLGSASCSSSGPAVLRVCTSAAHLVLHNVVVRGAKVASTPAAAALAVVAAGGVTLQNASVSGVRGGTALRVVVGGDLRVLGSSFSRNQGAVDDPDGVGGLHVVAGAGTRAITMQGCSFLDNSGGSVGGANVNMTAVKPGGWFQLVGANLFRGCWAQSSFGAGGLRVDASRTVAVVAEVGGEAVFADNRQGAFVVVMDRTVGGSVTIDGRAAFSDNRAFSGAGAYVAFDSAVNGTATVASSVSFTNNGAVDSGGAVYLSLAYSSTTNATIAGSARFVNNWSDGYAGAAYLYLDHSASSTATLAGSIRFENNRAAGSGGAAHLSLHNSTDGIATVAGSATFVNNSAGTFGGATYFSFDSSTRGNAAIGGSARFANNTAVDSGGGAYFSLDASTNSTGTIAGSARFEHNTAGGSGGAGYFFLASSVTSTATIAGSASFAGNVADKEHGGAAAFALYNTSSSSAIVAGNASFVNNSAQTEGGAARVDCVGSTRCMVVIAGNTIFVGNAANGTGGGVYAALYDADGVQLNVAEAQFAGNTAASGGGGLVVYANTSRDASIRVHNCRFSGNRVEQGPGGGLVVVAGPPTDDENNKVLIHITNTTFTNNTVSSGTGGGLHVDGTSKTPKDCLLNTNHGSQTDCPVATATLRGVQLDGNSATLGGGMFAINTQCAITSSVFSSNTAFQAGGGAFTKGVTSMLFQDVRFSSNRALVQGGGLAAMLGDDFLKNAMQCRNCTFIGNNATTGGGVYQSGGTATFAASSISSNRAAQQGGGVAFHDVCGPGSLAQHADNPVCSLTITAGTAISQNVALVGGGVFVGIPGTHGINTSQLVTATARGGENVAVYSANVALAPGVDSLALTRFANEEVTSSIGAMGAMGLAVSADQDSTRLQVEFCRVEERGGAYLTGIENRTVPTSNSSVYIASFDGLRLMGGADGTSYCLRVFAPDYPLVRALEFDVRIRGCSAGEHNEAVGGCTPCPQSSFSFGMNSRCSLCDPNAACNGGATFVPRLGFWHSAWNSGNVHACPNMRACTGDRRHVSACQANASRCDLGLYKASAYSDLQCERGYEGRLCARCAAGYGSGTLFTCRKCASRRSTVVYLVLACTGICLVVACIGYQAIRRRSLDSLRFAAAATSRVQGQPDGALQPGDGGSCSAASSAEQQQQQQQLHHHHHHHHQHHHQLSAPAHGALASLPSSMQGVEAADVFKVLVVYLQYVGILHNLVIDWPPSMQRLMGLAKLLVSPASSDWVTLDCLGRTSASASLWLRMLLTLLLLALACALACLAAAWGPCLLRTLLLPLLPAHCRGRRVWRLQHAQHPPLADVAIATAAVGIFVAYASMVSMCLSAFSCLSVDGSRYWARDMRLRCWSREHARGALALGVPGVAVLCVGVPLTLVVFLSRQSDRTMRQGVFEIRFGFLYRVYRPSCRCWEALLCLQTAFLVAVNQFARQLGPLYQLVAVMGVLLVTTAVWQAQRPFRSGALMALYSAGMICLQVTCLLMMLLLRGYTLGSNGRDSVRGPGRDAVAALMLLLNCVFVVACMSAMVHSSLQMVVACGSRVRLSLQHFAPVGLLFGLGRPNRDKAEVVGIVP